MQPDGIAFYTPDVKKSALNLLKNNNIAAIHNQDYQKVSKFANC